ncbi:MAG: autotransporter outer membrane beta-barrel domain-containing protein, partial [Selenomonas sp.]|nr:autotransporter outer membrane beta-barrel domain-containing protein [Selenomonas sp.]
MKRKRICALTAAVLSNLAMPITCWAAESPYLATEYCYYGGEPFAEINFLAAGAGIGNEDKWLVNKATYTLGKDLVSATVKGAAYWTDIIAPNAENTTPWQIFITTNNSQNAYAASYSLKSDGETAISQSYRYDTFYLRNQLKEGAVMTPLTYEDAEKNVLPEGSYAFSNVVIGKNFGAKRDGADDGWWVDAETALPTNEQAADFVGTIRHELGHALGITCVKTRKKNGSVFEYYINPNITDKLSWTLHLQDQNGTPAKAGMKIVDSDDGTGQNVFVVGKTIDANGSGYAYFVGEHVKEALDGAKFFGRSALPVVGWERRGRVFGGAHLQTSGMMSHRDYSNYTTFLEVELAVMQDLGYKIDRKAFFGRSIYGNGGNIINNQGYFARNAEGTDYLANTYSLVTLGVGMHIYGSDNKVTQNADIMTKGAGAVGIRVDGTGNTLVVPEDTEIHADGKRGNGLLIAYGRNHSINQVGTVTAKGEGGTGVRFDFGSSTNGALDEYRGSYIRYDRNVNKKSGEISSATNLNLLDMGVKTYNSNVNELNGPLVENYNLSGTLIGSENAIYISKNAFVKNININEGARIQGNITSDWKQFG